MIIYFYLKVDYYCLFFQKETHLLTNLDTYLVEIRKRNISLSLLNSWTYFCLSCAGVDPSRRLYTQSVVFIYISRISSSYRKEGKQWVGGEFSVITPSGTLSHYHLHDSVTLLHCFTIMEPTNHNAKSTVKFNFWWNLPWYNEKIWVLYCHPVWIHSAIYPTPGQIEMI